MRSGTIELPSGRWHWTLLPQWTGATIIFQHRDRVHDEMRSWTPDHELTEQEARELAADALERTWTDVDGLRWRLSMELPTDRRNETRGTHSDANASWLVFKRGAIRKSVALGEGSRLGDLSHYQLKELLESAVNAGSGYLG